MPEKPELKDIDSENVNQKGSKNARLRKRSSLWGYFIWFFLIILIFSFFIQGSRSNEITYTDFRDNVNKGNVASVVFLDHKIEGKFTDAYVKANKEKNVSPDFVTRIPVIQGSELITFLENHNVKINAEKAEHSSAETTKRVFIKVF